MESINNKWKIALPITTLLLFVISMIAVFHVSWGQLGSFILYQIILILIPGFAAVLLTNQKMPVISTFCYSYICGYTINILEYFGVKFFESYIPIYSIPLLILIVSAIIILIKKNNIKDFLCNSYSSDQFITLSFLAIILFLNIFLFALPKMDLGVGHRDFMWWCNNTISLKLMFPPDLAFASGFKLFYHYFSNIPVAFFSLISGIDVVTLSIPLYTLTKTIIMVGAADFVLNTLDIKNPKVKALGFMVILLASGFEKWSHIYYSIHTLKMTFGFDIGLAFGLMYTALLIKQFFKTTFDLDIFITTTIFWFICIGAKAPIASILLIFTGLVCLYWLIKKQFLLSFVYGLVALITFFFVSYTFVGLGSVMEGNATWELQRHVLSDYGVNSIHSILTIIFRLLVLNPALLCLTVIATIINIKLKKANKIEPLSIILFSIFITTSIIGLFLWFIIKAGGGSEAYYCMSSFIPLFFYIGLTYNALMNNLDLFTNEELHKYKTISVALIIVSVILFIFSPYGKRKDTIKLVKQNIVYLMNYKEKMNNISPLIWLRDNSEPNTIMISNNMLADRNEYRGTFYYTVLTERGQYLDETNMLYNINKEMPENISARLKLIDGVFANKISDLKKLKDLGISYVISKKEVTPNFNPDSKYLELINENKIYRIYKVK